MTEDSSQPAARRLLRRAGVLLAATVAIITVGGVAWAAASPSPSPSPSSSSGTSPSQTSPAPPGWGDRMQGFAHRMRGADGMRGALHGEFVVPKSGGGYETVLTQTGTVSAVSADSITVKSSDGYSKTYSVSPDTLVTATRDGIGSVKTGDEVRVVAISNGSGATVRRLADVSLLKANGPDWAPRRGQPAPAPSSAPSSGATGQPSAFITGA